MALAPGARVVVRHLLGTGAATDLIGRLVDDGDPVVIERDGARHAIARQAIVAMKQIPPKPLRPSEIRSLDLARARGWLSVEHEWIDGWLCRAAPGIVGQRANCAAPLHPEATLERLDGVRAWFAERGLPLRLSISDRLMRGAPPLASITDVLTAPAVAERVGRVQMTDRPDAQWLALTDTASALATSADGAVRFASILIEGSTVATGRLTLTADAAGRTWGGIGSIAVAPEFRGRGLASQVTRALIASAADGDAARVYLEVGQDNAPAQQLYRALGFEPHHRYGYRTVEA